MYILLTVLWHAWCVGVVVQVKRPSKYDAVAAVQLGPTEPGEPPSSVCPHSVFHQQLPASMAQQLPASMAKRP